MKIRPVIWGLLILLVLSACQEASPVVTLDPAAKSAQALKVLATESFIADIAQNIAGKRLEVEALVPIGMDPHSFEPSPQDIAKIADCSILIENGAGLESWMQRTLSNAGGAYLLVEASRGLASRTIQPGEGSASGGQAEAVDPHFWLDPINVITYAENIRDGLIQVDPAGKEDYIQNAASYISQLRSLDQWVTQQVDQVPSNQRLLVTNHEEFGYFADRYNFKIIGTINQSFSSESSPSAQQIAQLIDQIRASQARAIFLETGANQQLANQVAKDTGIKVITGLITHSLTNSDGDAPDYIAMIKYDTRIIVDALR